MLDLNYVKIWKPTYGHIMNYKINTHSVRRLFDVNTNCSSN